MVKRWEGFGIEKLKMIDLKDKRGKKFKFGKIIFLLIILIASIFYYKFSMTGHAVVTETQIIRVIDGDTIETIDGDKIRLIGINTPEKGQKYYKEAKEKIQDLVLNKTVSLESDIEDRDRYGRLLRYVYVDGIFVNELMVKSGLAYYYEYGKTKKYKKELINVEEQAKKNELYLWKGFNNINNLEDSKCLSISLFHYDAKGNDDENLNDEYVVFENKCNKDIDMTEWTINDVGNNLYKFDKFIVKASSEFILYTGQGKDNETVIYWNVKRKSIWNNNGDILYLRNSNDDLVIIKSY